MYTNIYSEIIRNFLIDDLQNIDIHIFDSIDSTNTYLKKICNSTNGEFTTIIANEQTNGRGRLGRNFFSPADTGIYMSFEIKPDMHISDATFITTATSVAVCKAIENVTNLNPKIKWINDIYIDNKKVCGILAEAVTDVNTGVLQSIIIGIGINVATSKDIFPDEIKDVATSLNKDIDRNQLIASILNHFYIIYNNSSATYMNEYKSRSLIIGKKIYYIKNGQNYYATALDFTDNGGLIVKNDNGTVETLTSGEISLRLI
ncbi:MAG: biotin--[acetyl-CoA-carboxylase] ligase [Lachnospiraceae bacterium]|nr:biotin--[acetyl-CoA-carboxylase] ligase [Lachnospiraceae bacterium]